MAFPPGGTRTLDDFEDGASSTVSIIEVDNGNAVHWMDPNDDIGYRYLTQLLPGSEDTVHKACAQVGFADGSVMALSTEIPPGVPEALATVSGGEVIDEDDF